MVKNPPARQKTQEMRVGFLDQEDPLELEVATHSSILAWEIPWTEELEGHSPWGCKESVMSEHTHTQTHTQTHTHTHNGILLSHKKE